MEYYAEEERRNSYLLSWHGWNRDYYAKWNKPVCDRQIPYDLTYKRNLMNKKN